MKFGMRYKLVVIAFLSLFGCARESDKTIPVVYPVTVDALKEIGKGTNEVLIKKGYQIKEYSAEGDATKFPVVVDAAIAQKTDVIITVGTQITNTILGGKYSNTRPKIIAAAIYEPEKIQIPEGQIITIISDNPSKGRDAIKYMINKVLKNIKKVGILQNKGEINSVESARQVADVLNNDNVKVISGYISSSADLSPVVKSLLRQGVDLIVIPHDKIAVANAGAVVRLGMNNDGKKVPVFSLDDGTVLKDGVLFAVSADYEAIGRVAGTEMLLAKNDKSYRSKIIYPENIKLVVNKKIADIIGIDKIIESADDKRFKIVLINK